MGISRSYFGATAQQQQWTEDAINGSSFPWDRISLTVEFHFVTEEAMQGSNHFDKNRYLFGDTNYGGGVATIRIWNELDTKGLDEYEGKDFFGETIIHEIGHGLQFKYIPDQDATLVALFHDDVGRKGTPADWAPMDKPWEQRIIEAFAEFFKDVYFAGRKFDDRTDWKVDQADFVAWLNFIGDLFGGPEEHQQLTVLGDILGDYNLGSWASVPPAPGNIYGISGSEPGQPVFVGGVPVAYDYVILANIQEAGAYYIPWWAIYPFVHFWPLLDNPRHWKLSLLIHGGYVGPFTEENPGGVPPDPGLRLAHFQFGPVDTDIFFGDLVNVVLDPFTATYNGEFPIPDVDAQAIAETSMSSGTPFFDYRDYGGGAGFNDNASSPFRSLTMRWEWDVGSAPANLAPWPYAPHEYNIGTPDHGHILHHRPVTGHGIS